jgi:hypothetical protein
MTVDELKAKVESYREGLKEKVGHPIVFAMSGPVGMSVIDAIVDTLETMEKRIKELDAKLERRTTFS